MKVLVAYESKHRSTQGIAERIATRLRLAGQEVHARSIDEVTDLDGYEAFVIGSAVYYGRWMKKAADFVRNSAGALQRRPVWLFSSGPVGTAPPVAPKEIAELSDTLKARDHKVFYGALHRKGLSLGERIVVAGVKAPDGDFRQWDEIDKWAEGIASVLAGSKAVAA